MAKWPGLGLILGAGVLWAAGLRADVEDRSLEIDLPALSEAARTFFEEEMEERHLPGGGLVIVHRGRVVLSEGYGVADRERGIPLDPERSVVRVGSVSKTVTALAALLLAEQGRIDLDGDVAALLPDLPIEAPGLGQVTPFHLLTQTAGFGERLFGQHARQLDDLQTLEAYLNRYLPPRRRPAGLVINYNDHHTSLAGLLVERAVGEPFAVAVSRLVFEPLGMTSSSFEQVDLEDELGERMATAYRLVGEDLRPLSRDYVITTPAAGLFTTVEDMGRFVALLASPKDGPFKPETVAAITATQFQHGPGMRGRGFGLAEGELAGWRALHKDGQCSGFTARIVVVPELELAWFSLANLSIFGRAGSFLPVASVHRRLADRLAEVLLPEAPAAATAPAAEALDPPSPIARFVGTYRDTMDPAEGWEGALLISEVRVTESEDGSLSVFGTEEWVEIEPGAFRPGEGGAAILRFLDDDKGRARWVTLHAGAWERVSGWRTARVMRGAMAVTLLVLLVGGIVGLVSRRRGSASPAAVPIACAAAALVLFVVGLGLAFWFGDVQRLYSGVGPWLRLVFLLPWLATGAIIVAVARWIGQLREQGLTVSTAAWGTVVVAGAILVVYLRAGRLLGWPL